MLDSSLFFTCSVFFFCWLSSDWLLPHIAHAQCVTQRRRLIYPPHFFFGIQHKRMMRYSKAVIRYVAVFLVLILQCRSATIQLLITLKLIHRLNFDSTMNNSHQITNCSSEHNVRIQIKKKKRKAKYCIRPKQTKEISLLSRTKWRPRSLAEHNHFSKHDVCIFVHLQILPRE